MRQDHPLMVQCHLPSAAGKCHSCNTCSPARTYAGCKTTIATSQGTNYTARREHDAAFQTVPFPCLFDTSAFIVVAVVILYMHCIMSFCLSTSPRTTGAEQIPAFHQGRDLITAAVPTLPCFTSMQGYTLVHRKP